MFKLPEGEYTICVEFFPAKIDGVNVNAVSTALNVNRQEQKFSKLIPDRSFTCTNGAFLLQSISCWI